MKIWLSCTHEIDDFKGKMTPTEGGGLLAVCSVCGLRRVLKFGNSEADQRTHTSRLAQ